MSKTDKSLRTTAIQEAIDALKKSEAQFMMYAESHRSQGKTEKAATNYGFSLLCGHALGHLKLTTHCEHEYVGVQTSIELIKACAKCEKDLLE